jgi:CheY-like chemotaxis protein
VLTVNLDENAAAIKADKSQIEQVLMNLVVNARDAMEGKGGTLVLETQIETKSGTERSVTLMVRDTGKGMSAEVKERIFEPFFTTKEVGKGTGLGLSTVYGIVSKHNGQIAVESEEGKGTHFKLSFPMVASKPTVQSDNSPGGLGDAAGMETIMLVEDEEAVRTLAACVLKEAGYTVIEAANGVEALQVLDGHKAKIDLLLTDVIMPQMGGKELARGFRAKLPSAPVIYMSGYTGQEPLLDESKEDHAFLQKPFMATELLRKIRDVLESA